MAVAPTWNVTRFVMSDDQQHDLHGGTQPVDGRAATGSDPWASFEPLYDEHHDRLYRVAVLLCSGRVADAEDAVAETFINVHRAWLDGRVEEFFPYARRSLVNFIMGGYRKTRTAEKYQNLTSIDPDAGRSFDEHVVDNTMVMKALDELTPRQRTAVVLRFFEDLPYQAIADEMQVALGTAKAQVSIGLSQLRRVLSESTSE